MPEICLATEDSLSEDVGIRLISELGRDFHVGQKFRQNGFGFLKKRILSFCEIAQRSAFLLITDLDTGLCPSTLKLSWVNPNHCPNRLLFRVAVREIESWLLADHEGMKKLLDKGASRLPDNPDQLTDPKKFLINSAQRAPRQIRDDLVPERGSNAIQGFGYNQRLGLFVREMWSPERAALRSDSLRRAIGRLQELKDLIDLEP